MYENTLYSARGGDWGKGGWIHTASVHLNSPTKRRVSVVVMRRVLLMREVRYDSAFALDISIAKVALN